MSMIPVPGATASVWVVEGYHTFFDALTWMDQLSTYTTQIFSLDDIVHACARDAIGNSRTIDFLAIFGHGTGGYQSAGAGKVMEETGTKSICYKGVALPGESHLVGPAEKKLVKLNGLLSPGATILLAGCNVGEGGEGDGLLTTVSTILAGRTVQAFESKVHWWTGVMTGSLKSASGTSVSSSFAYMTIEVPY